MKYVTRFEMNPRRKKDYLREKSDEHRVNNCESKNCHKA